jgi:indole-3-glycerol phosphate synthase
MGFLTDAVERVRRDLDRNPLPEGTLLLRVRALPPAADFHAALAGPGTSVIAEVKRRSPSAGEIGDPDPGEQAARYERGGAAAISVLTEPRHFDGSLSDLRSVRRRTFLPVLRKDFIVHPAQVIEARAEGADAVLLIAAVLTASEIDELIGVGGDLGMSSLVETHTAEDLDKAIAAEAQIVGVNARDLETLDVDLEQALELARTVPADRLVVVESGISERRQVEMAEEAGASAVLVGETLMRSKRPEVTVRRLLGALAVAKPGAEG